MQFWNVKKLAERLNKGVVSQKEQMHYLLAGTLLYVFCLTDFSRSLLSPVPLNMFDMMIGITEVVFTALTIISCYRINQENDAKDFVMRFISLNWPITIRVIGLAIILAIILIFSQEVIYGDNVPDESDSLYVLFTFAVFTYALLAMQKYMRIASQKYRNAEL